MEILSNMTAKEISLDKAKKDKLFYFLANVVVYRESDGRCLILLRSKNEKVHPGKFGVVGGKLEWKDLDPQKPSRVHGDVLDYLDAVENLLIRETREEAGIEIEPKLRYINSVAYIRPDGVPAVLVKFAAKYAGGEVRLEEGAFDGYAWVDAEEVKTRDCLEGIAEEVAAAIRHFSREVSRVLDRPVAAA